MRVLIAEDDAVSQRILEAFLVKWGYEVAVAAEGEEAWGLLQASDPPRMAVLDWMMPGRDGTEICRGIRRRMDRAYTYVILLTARGQKEDIVNGLEAGADDYVTKPFDPFELRARLNAGRRILELQDQLVQARESLRDQASRDPLLNILNHGTILKMLRKEVARASRTHCPLAIAMIDVDQFKTINDTYGHQAGDAVLVEACRRLQAGMRTYDSLGRYGGDELLAIFPGCDRAAAARFAESFRARVGSQGIETPQGLIPITLSLGVAALDDMRDLKPEEFVRIADAALYRAKSAGRNCVALATDQDVAEEVLRYRQEYDRFMLQTCVANLPPPHSTM